MVTMPFFVMFAFVAFCLVKWGPFKAAPVVMGLVVGLYMASTSLGPPVIEQITDTSRAAINTVSKVGS